MMASLLSMHRSCHKSQNRPLAVLSVNGYNILARGWPPVGRRVLPGSAAPGVQLPLTAATTKRRRCITTTEILSRTRTTV
jgi:hypothetical protein